jgi:hypothetical protein
MHIHCDSDDELTSPRAAEIFSERAETFGQLFGRGMQLEGGRGRHDPVEGRPAIDCQGGGGVDEEGAL